MLDKYDLDVSDLHTLADIDEPLRTIHEGENEPVFILNQNGVIPILNVLTPPSLEMDFVLIKDEVSAPLCTTFAPVSRFCPSPAKVMPVNSILDPLPFNIVMGYR